MLSRSKQDSMFYLAQQRLALTNSFPLTSLLFPLNSFHFFQVLFFFVCLVSNHFLLFIYLSISILFLYLFNFPSFHCMFLISWHFHLFHYVYFHARSFPLIYLSIPLLFLVSFQSISCPFSLYPPISVLFSWEALFVFLQILPFSVLSCHFLPFPFVSLYFLSFHIRSFNLMAILLFP